jgi:hypothetical protein
LLQNLLKKSNFWHFICGPTTGQLRLILTYQYPGPSFPNAFNSTELGSELILFVLGVEEGRREHHRTPGSPKSSRTRVYFG